MLAVCYNDFMMEKLARFLLLSLLVALLSACATQQYYSNAVNSWVGADQEQVYRTWGYPDKIQRLPNGHKVLRYHDEEHGRDPIYSTPASTSVQTKSDGSTHIYTTGGSISGGGTFDYKCTTWFEIDRKGRVVNTSFRGNNCVATKNFMLAHTYQGF